VIPHLRGAIIHVSPPERKPKSSPVYHCPMDSRRQTADARIAQFENMVRPEADPNNDMAWYSLASAYADAGRPLDAAQAYEKCLRLNPAMSKAYQLAGAQYLAAGNTDDARRILTEGYTSAASRGDRMPMTAMADLLKQIGAPVPEIKGGPPVPGGSSSGDFICGRTGRPGSKMVRPPFRGPVGEWIQSNISQETFNNWIAQGTKVINELRLDLSRDEDEAVYDQHMREYLGIDEELYEKLTRGKEGTAGS
jgi:Fe-S cluster biosynthesis and repair protein YggX